MQTEQPLSYVHGASEEPLKAQTVSACFEATASRWPEREALVVRHQNVRWTYAELRRRIDAVAAGLVSLNLAPGARLGAPVTRADGVPRPPPHVRRQPTRPRN